MMQVRSLSLLLSTLLVAGVPPTSAGVLAQPAPTPASIDTPAPIGTPLPPGPAESSMLGYIPDSTERMTVPVNIDGKGPYHFIVDTGAERTVISRELARALDLGPGRKTVMHSMTEVREVPTVVIPTLEISTKTVRDIQAPALAEANLGAVGMLGVDSLQSQRILFDFGKKTMTITPSRRQEQRWSDDAIVVTARRRFGHLVLVDASIEGEKVWVIIDTGAQVSVGNEALRAKLQAKHKLGRVVPVQLISVTGGVMTAQATAIKKLRIGGVDITDMPIAFADVHPFKKLELTRRPALLLGMDALQLFERVSVDFANRKVLLLPGDTSYLQQRMMMASR